MRRRGHGIAGHRGRLCDRRCGRRGRGGPAGSRAGFGDCSLRADVALPPPHRRAGADDSREAASGQEDRESRTGGLDEGGFGPELTPGRLTGPAHDRREPGFDLRPRRGDLYGLGDAQGKLVGEQLLALKASVPGEKRPVNLVADFYELLADLGVAAWHADDPITSSRAACERLLRLSAAALDGLAQRLAVPVSEL